MNQSSLLEREENRLIPITWLAQWRLSLKLWTKVESRVFQSSTAVPSLPKTQLLMLLYRTAMDCLWAEARGARADFLAFFGLDIEDFLVAECSRPSQEDA